VKVRLLLLVQDRPVVEAKGLPATEEFTIELDEVFLDGPVTRRLAVLDVDADTNALLPGARFLPPTADEDTGRYELGENGGNYEERHFNQVSVFATVLRTMDMFEEKEVLGRALRWAFDGPQLLIVPRAGAWANAFYERESHSLQFFHFPSARDGRTVYTSLSHDIISHECGHAILDGIAPDLYHAITPQSLALHEAIADLTALIMAFRNHTLSKAVLAQTRGSIRDSTAFTRIAEEFGTARDVTGRAFYLRSLLNEKTLDPNDTSLDEDTGQPNLVSRAEPHELSQVLSGALYTVMVKIHEQLKRDYARRRKKSQYSVSGLALFVGVQRFKRMLFRALDYVPPGEVSFADYGRAVIAADQGSHPDEQRERTWLCEEFVRRCIVPSKKALEVRTNYSHPAVKDLDVPTLVESDWAAYEFANANRELLRIPPDVPFKVHPRLDVSKLYYRGGRTETVRECLFKVSWDHIEPNPDTSWFPSKRRVTVGTTLALGWEDKRIRALLTSDFEKQRGERDRLLLRLDDEGLIRPAQHALANDKQPLRSIIEADSTNGAMRVRNAARMLHIAGSA
jgi:hypothetical protein